MRAAARLAGAATLLCGFGAVGCSSARVAPTPEFEVVWERAGEGRAAITALAFDAGAQRLAVGDYRGGIEFIERRGDDDWQAVADPSGPAPGEILALAPRGSGFVALRRTGDPLGWGRLSGAFAASDGSFVGWSGPARQLMTSIEGGARGNELVVHAAAAAGRQLFLLIGKPPEPARLECRDAATLALVYQRELGHAAESLAVDAAGRRLLVAAETTVDVLQLADGAPITQVAARAARLQPLGDGRRVVLIAGDTLAVLDLGDGTTAASVGPAFVAHRGGVTAVALSADGTLLATGGARGDLELFRVQPPHPPRRPREEEGYR